MTINTLHEDVYALGFEDALEMTEGFIYAANRAQRTIFLELGEVKRGKIIASGLDTVSHVDLIRHSSGEALSFSAGCASAYSFKVSGKGEYTVRDGDGEHTFEFDSPMLTERGFIGKDGFITFLGDYSYTVTDLAFYASLPSGEKEDIPIYSNESDYDLSALITDYLAPAAAPLDANGERIRGARISADTLTLPSDYSGEVHISYKRLPRKIDAYSDEDVDIPTVCEHLLPLLTAAYLWLDDAPDKAQYYMSLYKDEITRTKRYLPSSVGGEYGNVTGWA